MKLTEAERGVLKYIRHYPEWVAEVETLADMRNAILLKFISYLTDESASYWTFALHFLEYHSELLMPIQVF